MAFECSCGLIFRHRQSLRRHRISLHPTTPAAEESSGTSSTPPSFACAVCFDSENNNANSKSEFAQHLVNFHDISVAEETLQFESMDDFHAWKVQVEQETCASYKKARGTECNKQTHRMTYICNRSGHYSTRGEDLRHLKTQGTRKIGAYCPSEMKLKVEKDGKCKVHFVKTHWGHERELAHLSLTKAERIAIANKIASKVPLNEILYEIRRNVSNPRELRRVDLLTTRDLRNIALCFNLRTEYMKHQSDALSVDTWVKEQPEENILFYKPQGTSCKEYPALSNEDFFLGFMNSAQATMLELYGGDIVCMDGTHGLNGYDFQLITLMVVDDMKEGYPCAFLFSNRTDKDALAIFFSKIKERLSDKMPVPKVFMSDMADSFYNAWIKTMEIPPEKRLYCTWHVDRAWQKNLSKIPSVDKKSVIYKLIRTLMEEVEEGVFTENLPKAVERMLNDPETRAFGEYFRENYEQKPHLWAFCYRLRCGVNTNMYVESLHKSLKYFELEGKKVKRLDRGIHGVMKFLLNKSFDRIITLHKGKITSKLQDLRARHKRSLEMNIDTVIQNGEEWSVASSDGTAIYTVSKYNETCSCSLACEKCKACVHRYVCTCLDSQIASNMCKHVHLVLTKIQKTGISDMNVREADPGEELHQLTIIDDEGDKRAKEKEILMNQVCSGPVRSNDDALLRVREDTLALLKTLSAEVQNSTNFDEIVALKRLLNSAAPVMAAVRESTSDGIQFKVQDDTKKRKLVPQQRFINFQSCKKKKPRTPHSEPKPTSSEKNSILFGLSQMK